MGRANDFYGLVKQNRPIVQQQGQFWGAYEYLNNYNTPVNQMIQKYQIQKLKNFQNNNTQAKLDQLNNFIFSIPSNQGDLIQNKIKELSIQKILTRILSILNSGLYSAEGSTESFRKMQGLQGHTTKSSKRADANIIVQEFQQLLQLISYSQKEAISISNILKAGLLGVWNKNIQNYTGFSSYAQWKANFAEEFVVKALSSNPAWKAIASGKFYLEGKQILQDIFAGFSSTYDIEFGSDLSYTVKKGETVVKKQSVTSINDFFEKMKKDLSTNLAVHIDDPLYDVLKELSMIKVQVKSGYGIQSLLNVNKRNSISFFELGAGDPFSGLVDLFKLKWIDSGNSSSSLGAWANYFLAKGITATNLIENDIYFTNLGFITAPDWMAHYNYMLKFNPEVTKIAEGFWTIPHPYRLEAVN